MLNYILQRKVRLQPHHCSTGKTYHSYKGHAIPQPASLLIISYPDHPGYYLLYLDSDGNELTDTYHDTCEQALLQAEWEFGIEAEEWDIVG